MKISTESLQRLEECIATRLDIALNSVHGDIAELRTSIAGMDTHIVKNEKLASRSIEDTQFIKSFVHAEISAAIVELRNTIVTEKVNMLTQIKDMFVKLEGSVHSKLDQVVQQET